MTIMELRIKRTNVFRKDAAALEQATEQDSKLPIGIQEESEPDDRSSRVE